MKTFIQLVRAIVGILTYKVFIVSAYESCYDSYGSFIRYCLDEEYCCNDGYSCCEKTTLEAGAIIGIVIAVLVLAVIIGIVLRVVLLKSMKGKKVGASRTDSGAGHIRNCQPVNHPPPPPPQPLQPPPYIAGHQPVYPPPNQAMYPPPSNPAYPPPVY